MVGVDVNVEIGRTVLVGVRVYGEFEGLAFGVRVLLIVSVMRAAVEEEVSDGIEVGDAVSVTGRQPNKTSGRKIKYQKSFLNFLIIHLILENRPKQ